MYYIAHCVPYNIVVLTSPNTSTAAPSARSLSCTIVGVVLGNTTVIGLFSFFAMTAAARPALPPGYSYRNVTKIIINFQKNEIEGT